MRAQQRTLATQQQPSNPRDVVAVIEPNARPKPAGNHHQDTNSTSNAAHEGESGVELPSHRVKKEREVKSWK
ncbi:hypothetical protein CUMW_183230 [Citrus unshiu]|uniref:Uncharacterized protein n=1 Tax=Citrus unshiu TaxID=55188 RepID=A0A2H5Q015_CITUN|nr:hypothetical protein CUMW_183230 [Citrus unshiu]